MPASQLNPHQPLTEIGVDSLMAIEFRSSILTNLGVAVPLVRILQGPNLVELAGSAHFPWYDQPAEFFTALDAWYAEQTAGARR